MKETFENILGIQPTPDTGVPFRLLAIEEDRKSQIMAHIANKLFEKWQKENKGFIDEQFKRIYD